MKEGVKKFETSLLCIIMCTKTFWTIFSSSLQRNFRHKFAGEAIYSWKKARKNSQSKYLVLLCVRKRFDPFSPVLQRFIAQKYCLRMSLSMENDAWRRARKDSASCYMQRCWVCHEKKNLCNHKNHHDQSPFSGDTFPTHKKRNLGDGKCVTKKRTLVTIVFVITKVLFLVTNHNRGYSMTWNSFLHFSSNETLKISLEKQFRDGEWREKRLTKLSHCRTYGNNYIQSHETVSSISPAIFTLKIFPGEAFYSRKLASQKRGIIYLLFQSRRIVFSSTMAQI